MQTAQACEPALLLLCSDPAVSLLVTQRTHGQVSNPMDLATMMSRLNGGHYPTTQHFEADLCLIATAAQQRWQDDAAYAQDIGDANELVDEARQAVTAIPLDLRRYALAFLTR